jgi:hypothetical protein
MARDSCDTGRKMFKTKAAALKAFPDAVVKRCDRCRQWHAQIQKRGQDR